MLEIGNLLPLRDNTRQSSVRQEEENPLLPGAPLALLAEGTADAAAPLPLTFQDILTNGILRGVTGQTGLSGLHNQRLMKDGLSPGMSGPVRADTHLHGKILPPGGDILPGFAAGEPASISGTDVQPRAYGMRDFPALPGVLSQHGASLRPLSRETAALDAAGAPALPLISPDVAPDLSVVEPGQIVQHGAIPDPVLAGSPLAPPDATPGSAEKALEGPDIPVSANALHEEIAARSPGLSTPLRSEAGEGNIAAAAADPAGFLQADTAPLSSTPEPVLNAALMQPAADAGTPALSQTETIAERVRGWRGINMASTVTPTVLSAAGSREGGPLDVSLQFRPNTAMGQLQLFAEHLNALAVNNPDGGEGGSGTSATAGDDAVALGARSEFSASAQSPASTRAAAAAFAAPFAGSFAQTLGQSFNDPKWSESFSHHIALLTGQKAGSAEIQLDPPELGSLMVRINVSGDQASISFVSQHAAVRDSIEQSFDRLHDLLREQGLDLLDVNVSDQSPDRQGQQQRRGGDGDAPEGTAQTEGTSSVRNLGLVDFYI